MKRRVLLASGLAAGAVALFIPRTGGGNAALVTRFLSQSFGAPVAEHGETRRFVSDFVDVIEDRAPPLRGEFTGFRFGETQTAYDAEAQLGIFLVTLYGMSSTVIRHLESGEDLVYSGLFDPYGEGLCLNPLGEMS